MDKIHEVDEPNYCS